MPRRHRAARDRDRPPPPRPPVGLADARLQAPGYVVRTSSKHGPYRCPGCEQWLREATSHLVVHPDDQPDLRRHWHTPCWERELRRLR